MRLQVDSNQCLKWLLNNMNSRRKQVRANRGRVGAEEGNPTSAPRLILPFFAINSAFDNDKS